jgi:hypothetical protein
MFAVKFFHLDRAHKHFMAIVAPSNYLQPIWFVHEVECHISDNLTPDTLCLTVNEVIPSENSRSITLYTSYLEKVL